MQERRAYVRVATKVNITYSKSNSSEKERLSFSKDISKGGVCLILSEELKESDVLDLKINLPKENAPINVTGIVVWIHKFMFEETPKESGFYAGIKFTKVNEGAEKKFDEFISSVT